VQQLDAFFGFFVHGGKACRIVDWRLNESDWSLQWPIEGVIYGRLRLVQSRVRS
jgi:hypothetical protein